MSNFLENYANSANQKLLFPLEQKQKMNLVFLISL